MSIHEKPPVRGAFFAAALAAFLQLPSLTAGAAPARPDLLLITLDTTRADSLGAYGAKGAVTPHLDLLAKTGTRFENAFSPVPLTLPAHASLFTGLLPAEHELRDNGWGRLDGRHPLLAETLQRAGYKTAAFPASRVLDARFGLDRGFTFYDDAMAAERIGQFGYPERPAAEVVDAALAWLAQTPKDAPLFLWVHFYDPHAPYEPPREFSSRNERERYAGEVHYLDRELGRLLAAWPAGREKIVAAVADHGEALGEHGEDGHGLLLYGSTLRVPLLIAGQGVPPAQVVQSPVGIVRLGATLLHLLGVKTQFPGKRLPLREDEIAREAKDPPAIFHETLFPGTAFGWSPLAAITRGKTKVIAAPRPELYALDRDPGELDNLLMKTEGPGIDEAGRRARRELEAQLTRHPLNVEPPKVDPEVAAELRSLGYLSGQSRSFGNLDPKEGVLLLQEFEKAGELEAERQVPEARKILETLVAKSPQSIPFLSRLAGLESQMGDREQGLKTLDRAIRLSPQLDFLHFDRGNLLIQAGQVEEAKKAWRLTLDLNPRFSGAWLRLSELALRQGEPAEEERLLNEALKAGTTSAMVYTRLAEIAIRRGELDVADRHLAEATRLLPSWTAPWQMWADLARQQGKNELAAEREEKARQRRRR